MPVPIDVEKALYLGGQRLATQLAGGDAQQRSVRSEFLPSSSLIDDADFGRPSREGRELGRLVGQIKARHWRTDPGDSLEPARRQVGDASKHPLGVCTGG